MKHSLLTIFVLTIFMFLFGIQATNCQTQNSYTLIGQMLERNQSSEKNPTYSVPCGTVNLNCYLKSAVTVGNAVQSPLSYFCNEVPTSYYVNYSRTNTACERGKTFQLTLTTNKNSAISTGYVYAFADWNRDGIFETSLGKKEISEISTKETPNTFYPISVPADASLGKTRIRIYLTTTNITAVNPTDVISSGHIYDFVLFATENTGTSNTAMVSVSSNNTAWGTASVKTVSTNADGKFTIGDNVTVEAIPAAFCDFAGWSNGLEIISTDKNYTFKVSAVVSLTAVFKTQSAIMEAPITSTAANPVWYQIKNAHTDTRSNSFIAYDNAISAGYTTALRIQKPEDFTDKFLWRLEASINGQVKLINRGTNKQITAATGAANEVLTGSDVGSDFQITTSGNANGSYSVKYNSTTDKLLNGALSFNLLLYNGGVGTGSGWFFYRVPGAVFTGVETQRIQKHKVYLNNDYLCLEGMEMGTQVWVYSMLGNAVLKCTIRCEKEQLSFFTKGVFVVLAKNTNGQLSSYKIIR
jgi:hypothetical protein